MTVSDQNHSLFFRITYITSTEETRNRRRPKNCQTLWQWTGHILLAGQTTDGVIHFWSDTRVTEGTAWVSALQGLFLGTEKIIKQRLQLSVEWQAVSDSY